MQGGTDPEAPHVCPRVVRVVDLRKYSDPGTGFHPLRAVLALYAPQSIDNQPMGLRSPHRPGLYRLGGYPFSSLGCRSLYMCRRISEQRMGLYPLPAALALCTNPRQSASRQGVGVSTPFGAVSTRGTPFLFGVVGVAKQTEGFTNRGWDYILPGCRGTAPH